MIKQAQIEWSNGSPVSTEFDDVYFSKTSGIEETRYVFLQHNQLPESWLNTDKQNFTIAETGFGTGLNFLCAWQLFEQTCHEQRSLHFVSVEKFPLTKDALTQALLQWPELKPYSEALLQVYPPLVPGWHRIQLPAMNNHKVNVVLHLFLGDVDEWLTQIEGKIDAWFLDGFAPAKNPEMWSSHLFQSMARLSHTKTTVATFTAAGLVKRGLQAAGFSTKKVKGFGKKREMLTATYQQAQGPIPKNWLTQLPWFALPKPPLSKTKTAIVIGAGIAGCSTAYSLAQRGWQVTLVDKHETPACGASGNAQGVLYAKLSTKLNPQSEFYLAGYLYSLQLLRQTMPDKTQWNDCGVLQLALNEKEQNRQQEFIKHTDLTDVVEWVESKMASELAGIYLEHDGLFFKNGAWVYPKAWCEKLIDHPKITFIGNTKIEKIEQQLNAWHVIPEQQSNLINDSFDAVIVCSAHHAQQLSSLSFLPTKPIAGQVTQLSNVNTSLKTVLCGDSYVTPMHEGNLNFGATYRIKSDNTDITQADHLENFEKLQSNFPNVVTSNHNTFYGRASVRCTTPDYFPIVGAVCEEGKFKQRFANLKKSKKWRFYVAAPYLKGLYVNLGHGSRGLSSAPLCSEMLAAQINGEVLPLCKSHVDMLSPNRFLVAQTIKGE